MKIRITRMMVFLLIAFVSQTAFGQSDTQFSGKIKWMDFWVGEWNLTWKDKDGKIERGFNEVYKTLDGKVIQENFRALDGASEGFTGKSWTVFNTKKDTWFQTWVDNQGSYLDFTFELEAGKRIFKRTGNDKDGNTIHQRMVFYNITENNFDWNWESSKDGKTWNLLWQIHYEKIKAAKQN